MFVSTNFSDKQRNEQFTILVMKLMVVVEVGVVVVLEGLDAL